MAASDPPSGSTRAAEDLVDAATGLDGRAWFTLRELVLRPWDMMQRAAFEHDPRYVGAVKLALAMSTLAIVLMSWLMPGEAYFERMQTSDPQAWAELDAQLTAGGICWAHFIDRFSNRHELLNTAATLLECGVFALVVSRLDRARPFMTHLSFVLYCYALWLIVTAPVQFVLASDLAPGVGLAVGLGMIALLPGIMILGLVRLYPASAARQLMRGLILVVLTAILFAVSVVAIAIAAMAWTRSSFGL